VEWKKRSHDAIVIGKCKIFMKVEISVDGTAGITRAFNRVLHHRLIFRSFILVTARQMQLLYYKEHETYYLLLSDSSKILCLSLFKDDIRA
jgi:hypothetical protein